MINETQQFIPVHKEWLRLSIPMRAIAAWSKQTNHCYKFCKLYTEDFTCISNHRLLRKVSSSPIYSFYILVLYTRSFVLYTRSNIRLSALYTRSIYFIVALLRKVSHRRRHRHRYRHHHHRHHHHHHHHNLLQGVVNIPKQLVG